MKKRKIAVLKPASLSSTTKTMTTTTTTTEIVLNKRNFVDGCSIQLNFYPVVKHGLHGWLVSKHIFFHILVLLFLLPLCVYGTNKQCGLCRYVECNYWATSWQKLCWEIMRGTMIITHTDTYQNPICTTPEPITHTHNIHTNIIIIYVGT